MTDDNTYGISRRKALIGLGTIGVAGAGAGVGTSALFTDEESFEDNTLVAGELNLLVDYWTSQNTDTSSTDSGTQDGAVSTLLSLTDVKPGDDGSVVFCPKIVDNPAYLWAGSGGLTQYENGYTEPEGGAEDMNATDDSIEGRPLNGSAPENEYPVADVDGGDSPIGSSYGELADNVQVTVSYCKPSDDLDEGEEPSDPSDFQTIRELNNPEDYTLADLILELQTGFPISNDSDGTYPASGDEDTQVGPCLCIDWNVPIEVGNEIQSDSVEFDIGFGAVQSRNVSDPAAENPFADVVLADPSDPVAFTAQVDSGPVTVVSAQVNDDVVNGWPNNDTSYQIEVNIDADTGDDGAIGENGTVGDAGNDDFRLGYAGPDADPSDVNGGNAGAYLRRNIGTGGSDNRVDVGAADLNGFTALESSDQLSYLFVIDWETLADNPNVPDLPSAPSEIVINEVFGTDGSNATFFNPDASPTEASGVLTI